MRTLVLASAATLLAAALAGAVYVAKGSEKEALGAAKPAEGYAQSTVQQLAQEEKWKDQKVQFEGTIAKVGCIGCGGVIVADKTWRISAEPEDPSKFRIPARPGTRLRIWGVLRVSDGFREVKAHRVEFLEEEKKDEKEKGA